MTFYFGMRSNSKLSGVHPDLVKVMRAAITASRVDFSITEGLRTKLRQEQLFKAGATRTMNSRHLTGHAVDVVALVGGRVAWDWPLYEQIANTVLRVADELQIPVVWGGNWKTFKDGPHFELDRKFYP